MKYHFLLFLFLLPLLTIGQEKYSYITDRIFNDPADLIGYNFKPSGLEIPDQAEEDISPGEYSFGITMNNLYIEGENIRGVYSVNQINTVDYGFKLTLMNARDPTIQGHLKIVLNDKNQVDVLVFKRSTKEKEIIFFLPKLPENLEKQEDEFFTDLGEVKISAADSLWGKTIYPFLKIHQDQNVQERLDIADSTSITFVETITMIDKTKKPKKAKGKNKKAKVEMANVEAGEEDLGATPPAVSAEALEAMELYGDSSLMDAEMEKKFKIIKEYSVTIRSILTYDDGSTEDKIWEYPIKKVTQREDDLAGPGEERYQIELESTKESILLYLFSSKGVSSLVHRNKKYLMRGY